MGGSTQSSNSENRPLTAAERQDLYRSSIGNILNTYNQSGLPYGGVGSMNTTPAVYNPNSMPVNNGTIPMTNNGGTWSSGIQPNGQPLYNANSQYNSNPNNLGKVTLDPKTFLSAGPANPNMPTGAADPGGINLPVYQTPDYQGPGSYQRLAQGDYSALENSLRKGYTAGLDAAKETDLKNFNSDAAKRGIWSSGLALQGENDINKAYAPQYEAAGAQATGQRYNLESGENAGANIYNQAASNAANTFNTTNAQNQFSAGWAPLNYLSSLWAGTAGQVGGSNSFGASVNI